MGSLKDHESPRDAAKNQTQTVTIVDMETNKVSKTQLNQKDREITSTPKDAKLVGTKRPSVQRNLFWNPSKKFCGNMKRAQMLLGSSGGQQQQETGKDQVKSGE